MNKIRKNYYPVLAVLTLIALVLGLVSATVSFAPKASNTVYTHMKEGFNKEHNSYTSSAQDNVRDDLVNNIIRNNTAMRNASGSKSNGYQIASFGEESNYGPRYIVQSATLEQSTFEDLSTDDEMYYVDGEVENIIVAIPGKTLEDAVLFVANYDTAAGSQSATESMQAVALLEMAMKYAESFSSGKVPDKTLLFVISDAEREGGYGLRAFRHQFNGFGGIANKVSLMVNFGATGTGPLSVMADGVSVSQVTGFASGLVEAINADDKFYDYEVYDCAKINVFFGGNREYIDTARDTVDNLSVSKINEICGTMDALIDAYGFGSYKTASAGGTFSYMNGSFSYPSLLSYVFGGIALLLLIGAVLIMVRNSRKIGDIIKGVVAQLAALILTAIILYVSYFLLALILAGFGTVPIHAITTITYMNVGLFISSLILAFAAYTGVFLLIRRFYKVKATDGARGAALIIMLVGIVMAFAFPAGSFGFALSAVLEGITLILTSIFSKKFKEKFGADIERLLAYFIPVILLTPAMIPVMLMASYSLSVVYFPLILTVAALGMAVIAPYFAALKPVLSRAVAKLPKHTIRVERTVTEKVEGAKKGRFTEVTHKKVTNEKVEWTYRNRYCVALIGVLSAILIIIFAASPAHHFATNAIDVFSYREAVKNDSIVFTWDLAGDTASSTLSKLVVYDQAAFKYFGNTNSFDREDYTWNKNLNAYEKVFVGDVKQVFGTASPVTVNVSGGILNILPFGNANDSYIDIKLKNVSAVTEFIVMANYRRYEITNDGKSAVNLVLPYGDDDYKNFTIEFKIDKERNNGSGSLNVGLEYRQYISGTLANGTMNNIGEYENLKSSFLSTYEKENLNCGMILSKSSSYTVGEV